MLYSLDSPSCEACIFDPGCSWLESRFYSRHRHLGWFRHTSALHSPPSVFSSRRRPSLPSPSPSQPHGRAPLPLPLNCTAGRRQTLRTAAHRGGPFSRRPASAAPRAVDLVHAGPSRGGRMRRQQTPCGGRPCSRRQASRGGGSHAVAGLASRGRPRARGGLHVAAGWVWRTCVGLGGFSFFDFFY